MQQSNTIIKYNLIMRILHWLSALILLSLICSGIYMTSLDKSVSYKFDIYHVHKSIGVIALVILIIRLITRLLSRIPKLPDSFTKFEKISSSINHWIMYFGFLAIALSGFIMADMSPKKAVPFFAWQLPNIFGKNKEIAFCLHDIHILLPYIMLAFLALHVLGAIKNLICKKAKYTFKRIW